MYCNKVFLAEMPLGVKCCRPCGCCPPEPYLPPCGCQPLLPCPCPPPWPREDYLPHGVDPQPPCPPPRKEGAAMYILRDSWHLPPCAEVISSAAAIDGWEAATECGCRSLCVRYHLLICWREQRHLRRTRLENCAYLPWPQGACPGDLLMLVCSPPQLQCCAYGMVQITTQLKATF